MEELETSEELGFSLMESQSSGGQNSALWLSLQACAVEVSMTCLLGASVTAPSESVAFGLCICTRALGGWFPPLSALRSFVLNTTQRASTGIL